MPLVITSLGAVPELVEAVHSYGGLVFHDVINMRHAEKAIDAGVDGLIAVCAGAGGHAGLLSPFALVAGDPAHLSTARSCCPARCRPARTSRRRRCSAPTSPIWARASSRRRKASRRTATSRCWSARRRPDILYTPAISGVNANFMRQSIAAAGLDPDNLAHSGKMDMGKEAKVWKTIWSAGQGVGSVADVPAVAELCARLKAEYAEARRSLA